MRTQKQAVEPASLPVPKCPSGIHGLDDITLGGLPRGRATLVCGGAGCGKTLLGMEFLVRGARDYGEPGVCLSFEETASELSANVASLGLDVPALLKKKKLAIDYFLIERCHVQESGDYDLEALFLRLGHAVNSVGAKRVLIDSIEALFAGLNNEAVLRSELRRLFRWLKDRQLTALVTGESRAGLLTRHGLEEFISDCVIQLDHRVNDGVLTRRLRVVKYRGTTHGTNEYPFLIESDGISVLPVTSVDLNHKAITERVSTGVPDLDEMLGGKGYYRGSSILVTGTAGTGKTSLNAHFVDAACARGEKCVFFSFEESSSQIIRNMKSIGIDLGQWVDQGLLHFRSARPTAFGLEMHLVKIHKIIREIEPSIVVVDPITGLLHAGAASETKSMVLRLVDFLKEKGITALMTSLAGGGEAQQQTDIDISSLVDTWLLLRDIENGGEQNRGLYILKARGVAHSNQIREFHLTDHGVELCRVYLGAAGMLTGSARVAQEARDAAEALNVKQEMERKKLELGRRRRAVEKQLAALQVDLETEQEQERQLMLQEQAQIDQWAKDRQQMAASRYAPFGEQTQLAELKGGGNCSRGRRVGNRK